MIRSIFVFVVFSFASFVLAGEAYAGVYTCSICGAPHGNLQGNGACVDCNVKNGIKPQDAKL